MVLGRAGLFILTKEGQPRLQAANRKGLQPPKPVSGPGAFLDQLVIPNPRSLCGVRDLLFLF